MAYIDYSSNWVLDQFFTFLQANQLGTNDEHLYDSFAVEHNINTATIDGTHKANSILGSYINTTPISTGSQAISGAGSWIPTVGVYQIIAPWTNADPGDRVVLQIYVSGSWRESASIGLNGIVFCDGTNMRIYSITSAQTVWYQKF